MPITKLASNETFDESCRTFILEGEGHTLGNVLRGIISSYPDVQFCGYSVPHPAENNIHFRIQMYQGQATDALKRGLEDLVKVCDVTLSKFDESLTSFQSRE
ncbi:DNA-directed RNA polymerases I and III subunit RPAC2 [Euwallacea similis]|uniref:DNA-directed RNA polymerases I and III subunit RPAC2 n=1 Tax=Euwallacea similis TaxID=1736056 RepID=UPI00344E3195